MLNARTGTAFFVLRVRSVESYVLPTSENGGGRGGEGKKRKKKEKEWGSDGKIPLTPANLMSDETNNSLLWISDWLIKLMRQGKDWGNYYWIRQCNTRTCRYELCLFLVF
jgi:hypothetical protein